MRILSKFEGVALGKTFKSSSTSGESIIIVSLRDTAVTQKGKSNNEKFREISKAF